MITDSYIPRESKEIQQAEHQLKLHVEKAWAAKLEKLPTTYSLDYAIKREEEVKAWAELKCRNHAFGTHDTYMISLKKWKACREIESSSHKNAFLIVGFTDGAYWLQTSSVNNFQLKMGGRSDRDWSVDREPCVFFNINYFKKLQF